MIARQDVWRCSGTRTKTPIIIITTNSSLPHSGRFCGGVTMQVAPPIFRSSPVTPRECIGSWMSFMGAIKWTRPSCRTFAANTVRLSAPRADVQPRQLHADAGDAEDGGAVVADRPAREADQDRRE